MKKVVIVAVVLLVVVGLVAYLRGGKSEQTLTTDSNIAEPSNQAESTDPQVSYTLGEVAGHADASSCWMAIEGKVYDVTPYVQSGIHPGRDKILLGCGKDATTLYNNRLGEGTHSASARALLKRYLIGELAN